MVRRKSNGDSSQGKRVKYMMMGTAVLGGPEAPIYIKKKERYKDAPLHGGGAASNIKDIMTGVDTVLTYPVNKLESAYKNREELKDKTYKFMTKGKYEKPRMFDKSPKPEKLLVEKKGIYDQNIKDRDLLYKKLGHEAGRPEFMLTHYGGGGKMYDKSINDVGVKPVNEFFLKTVPSTKETIKHEAKEKYNNLYNKLENASGRTGRNLDYATGRIRTTGGNIKTGVHNLGVDMNLGYNKRVEKGESLINTHLIQSERIGKANKNLSAVISTTKTTISSPVKKVKKLNKEYNLLYQTPRIGNSRKKKGGK
jgi:hypothetical protein